MARGGSDVDLFTTLDPFVAVCNTSYTTKSKNTYEHIYHLSLPSHAIRKLQEKYKLRAQKPEIVSCEIVRASVEQYVRNLKENLKPKGQETAFGNFTERLEAAIEEGNCTMYPYPTVGTIYYGIIGSFYSTRALIPVY